MKKHKALIICLLGFSCLRAEATTTEQLKDTGKTVGYSAVVLANTYCMWDNAKHLCFYLSREDRQVKHTTPFTYGYLVALLGLVSYYAGQQAYASGQKVAASLNQKGNTHENP
jgi:hypothetical protein